MFIGFVSCTTKLWTRKKPAYWEFPETTTTERPDFSAEYCKSTNMIELGENITEVVRKPRRGLADHLIHSVVTYVVTLHRFIRKCNTTDDVAVRMARDLIQNKRPQFMDMELDMSEINFRVGFDKYEFQHFKWVMEDIQQSWEKLNVLIFGKKVDQIETKKLKKEGDSEELKPQRNDDMLF